MTEVRSAGPATPLMPPPPHDPNERVWLAELGTWQLRGHAPGGRFQRWLQAHGMGHLQLWHPERRISILTPSRLTLGRWELFPVHGWKLPVYDWVDVRDQLRSMHLRAPSTAALRAALRWFCHTDAAALDAWLPTTAIARRASRNVLSRRRPTAQVASGSSSPRGSRDVAEGRDSPVGDAAPTAKPPHEGG